MNENDYVLGVHPSSRGFGWALFESPVSPLDWGIVEGRDRQETTILKRFRNLLDRHQPKVLVLEQFEGEPAKRNMRIAKLARRMIALAEKRKITVCIVSRTQIAAASGSAGASTRDEIAAFVARNVDALRDRLPEKRKPWNSEHPNQALFSAAASALTWYAEQP